MKPFNLEENLNRDLEALKGRLGKMSTLVGKQLDDAVEAFTQSNRRMAYAVVIQDHRIDALEAHIDRLCQEFLVRHMPVSHHLRFVVAAVKVNSELERVGDYAVAIARRAVTLSDSDQPQAQEERIVEMARLSFQMLANAVEAFLTGDPDMAVRTLDNDRQVDEMNSQLFEALAEAGDQTTDLHERFALLGVINRIERVADRACNIAEEAVYAVRGEVLRHLPRHDMRVLFLCTANHCRSQMAEGIARQVAPAHFIFTSAGTDPSDVDERAVAYCAKRGVDISRQRAKSLDDVGPIEDFHVVVTLSLNSKEACPPVPYRTVVLDWKTPNPSKEKGTDEEIEAAYEKTFDHLKAKIEEMTDGLIGALEREED